MIHYNSIKQLFPLDLGELSDLDMQIEGDLLDQTQSDLQSIISELFASTATELMSRFENEYDVRPSSGQTIQDRRNAVVAKERLISALKLGGLKKSLFVSIAAAMGYQIQISDTLNMFRAGISRAGDPVYSTSQIWLMVVTVTNASSAPDLVALFTDIRPPYLRLEFLYA